MHCHCYIYALLLLGSCISRPPCSCMMVSSQLQQRYAWTQGQQLEVMVHRSAAEGCALVQKVNGAAANSRGGTKCQSGCISKAVQSQFQEICGAHISADISGYISEQPGA